MPSNKGKGGGAQITPKGEPFHYQILGALSACDDRINTLEALCDHIQEEQPDKQEAPVITPSSNLTGVLRETPGRIHGFENRIAMCISNLEDRLYGDK